jgi:hypothetical protein
MLTRLILELASMLFDVASCREIMDNFPHVLKFSDKYRRFQSRPSYIDHHSKRLSVDLLPLPSVVIYLCSVVSTDIKRSIKGKIVAWRSLNETAGHEPS